MRTVANITFRSEQLETHFQYTAGSALEYFGDSYVLRISIIFRSNVVADWSKSEKGLVSSFPRICSRMSIKGGIGGTPPPSHICCFLKDDSISFAMPMMSSRHF